MDVIPHPADVVRVGAPDAVTVQLQLLACPDPTCHAPAEVTDRFVLVSTNGPIEHLRTHCLHRHIFTVPTDRVAAPALASDARTPRVAEN
jgi:hypothetical protein